MTPYKLRMLQALQRRASERPLVGCYAELGSPVLRFCPMTKDASRLLEDALRLRAEDRAQLAEELLASLDDTEDDVEAAWATEVARRAADARASSAEEEDWRSALADVQREVLKR